MTPAGTIADAVRTSGLLNGCDQITVALSGGADSVALLVVLDMLREEYGYTLSAVHVHHGIRGAEADRDAAFCEALCKACRIPFRMVCVDVPAFAEKHHLSLETAARQLRYEALEQAAPAGFLATAHHAGDQAETMLFHLIRGSGLNGLCGIPAIRGRILRPLLSVTKTQILSFLSERNQDFVTDSSNFKTDAARNLLRHTVMPMLERCNPQTIPHMAKTAEMLSEDEALLTELADKAYADCILPPEKRALDSLSFQMLSDQPRPIRMRIYRRAVQTVCDPSFQKLREIDEILLCGSGKTVISGDFSVKMANGILSFSHASLPQVPVFSDRVPLPRKLPAVCCLFPQKRCEIRILEPENYSSPISPKLHNAFTRCTLDYDKIIGNPYFRQWHRADRITLPGRSFSSSLKTCIQAAFKPSERRCLYALYDDLGCIFCEGIGIAARVKPDAETKKCLRFFISPEPQHSNSSKE